MPATCSAHLSHNLITQIITGELYISLSSSLCSFLQSPVSPLGPNISLSTLLSAYVPPSMLNNAVPRIIITS
jgi:hypothetical protein